MATPIVPPRPTRANGTTAATAADNTPNVPPRPLRKTDPSPIRDTRSPLNELPNPLGAVTKRTSRSNLSTSDIPPRPPSVVSFPSVGQEGLEYASYEQLPSDGAGAGTAVAASQVGAPEQTRNIAHDMPLHAPRASVPQSTAKSRIETVTKTDSTQAAAAGIGRAKPDDDVHRTPADSQTSLVEPKSDDLRRTVSADPTLRQKPSFSSRPPSSHAHRTSRPASVYEGEHEHGIPEIGVHVPLLRNAGDVQAPSFMAAQSPHAPGSGFFNDGSTRAHQRRRSGRHDFAPPGSYGLHSHGMEANDQFEREWYAKHPDRALAEGNNVYGRPRPESALSSAELNRIVTRTEDGTDVVGLSTPGDEIGWSASDAYASRQSPRPLSVATADRKKRASSGSQPALDSPLRRSHPPLGNNHAVDDDSIIHVGAPEYDVNRYTGGGPADSAEDLGAHAGNTAQGGGWFTDRGDGTPILASDEVLKRRESASMQPAVYYQQHHYDDYDSDHAHDSPSRRSSVRPPSRPSSRPGSIVGDYHGGNLHRFLSHDEPHHGSGLHTPLEEIEEYEPLIPEGEDTSPKPRQKSVGKRPGLEHHHFPSQDIWEDTPSSLQFSTTVATPPEEQTKKDYFETPEGETVVREVAPDDTTADAPTVVKRHYALRGMEGRPGVQRFPSQDIWEDTPSSLQFSTTVGSPQMDETKGHPDERPTTSAIPSRQDDDDARATTTALGESPRPAMPSRPKHRSKLAEEITPAEISEQRSNESQDGEQVSPSSPEKSKAPPVPDRPKPTVPARPARPAKGDELTKSTSLESETSAEAAPPVPAKTKPLVPARPGGEKIAALKAGFMNDLNNRLKIGPQAPPSSKSRDMEPEVVEEAEKAPLADARKSRAKGPPRRKPAADSAPGFDEPHKGFSMSTTFTMWAIDETEELQVPAGEAPSAKSDATVPALEKALSDNAASNTEHPTMAEPVSAEKDLSKTPSGAELADLVKSSSPEENRSLQTKLESQLAEVGAAPAPGSSAPEEQASVLEPEEVSAEKTIEKEDKAIAGEDEPAVIAS